MKRCAAGIAALLLVAGNAVAAISIERLTWAGIKLVSGDTTVLIDAMATDIWQGEAPGGFVAASSETPRTYALITHTHNDHFDADGLKRVLGKRGYVICHRSIASYVASRGLRVIPADLYAPVMRGGFTFTAVPAEDGFGDEQVSWIVSDGDHKVLHAGDTLWHGRWDSIGRQHGPFDVAFLPISGVVVRGDPHIETAAVMTPLQALDAARLLRARLIVPIHFGFSDPPDYVEAGTPLETLIGLARARSQAVRHVAPGEALAIED